MGWVGGFGTRAGDPLMTPPPAAAAMPYWLAVKPGPCQMPNAEPPLVFPWAARPSHAQPIGMIPESIPANRWCIRQRRWMNVVGLVRHTRRIVETGQALTPPTVGPVPSHRWTSFCSQAICFTRTNLLTPRSTGPWSCSGGTPWAIRYLCSSSCHGHGFDASARPPILTWGMWLSQESGALAAYFV